MSGIRSRRLVFVDMEVTDRYESHRQNLSVKPGKVNIALIRLHARGLCVNIKYRHTFVWKYDTEHHLKDTNQTCII